MTDEQWKPIPGWEGFYEVSDHGRVRSLDRAVLTSNDQIRRYNGRLLKISGPGGNFYRKVTLRHRDRMATYGMHRLVLLAFVGPRPDGTEIRHLDGDSHNSVLTNLSYGTRSENRLDRIAHGTDPNVNKTRCPQGHAYDETNVYSPPSRPNVRDCKACMRRRQRAYTDRKRARAASVKTA